VSLLLIFEVGFFIIIWKKNGFISWYDLCLCVCDCWVNTMFN
jgi:hypothetical protein